MTANTGTGPRLISFPDPEKEIAANVDAWLRFHGWHPGEWIELQALHTPEGRYTNNYFAHANENATVVRLIVEIEKRKPQGIYFIMNVIDPACATRARADQSADRNPGARRDHRRRLAAGAPAAAPGPARRPRSRRRTFARWASISTGRRRSASSSSITCASSSEIEETGEYNLDGLFIRLAHAVDSIPAKRVVLETLEALLRRPN